MSEARSSVFTLRVPASSANLGPGFDSLALAMSLYLDIQATESEEFKIDASGRDAAICGSLSNNLILMTYTETLGALGLPAPRLSLEIGNGIPIGMGCGSSAAALVAGVYLASHFGGLAWSREQVLREAAVREGHPDNVAACVLGGVTASATADQQTVAVRVATELTWRLLLALPPKSLSTRESRAALPPMYTRADAVANVQASSLLVAACVTNRADLLVFAMRDRLHQPYREAVCPLYRRLRVLHGQTGVYGVVLSGAGPAVLLVVEPAFAPEAVHALGGEELSELLEVSVAQGAVSA